MTTKTQHYSDCAVHNEPALPAGPCDCGGYTEETTTQTKPGFTAGPLTVEFEDAVTIRDPNDGATAMLGNLSRRGTGPRRSPQEVAANAYLYAAAPALYEALEKCKEAMAAFDLDMIDDAEAVADAALALARGEG
jgi:hypothetical protein